MLEAATTAQDGTPSGTRMREGLIEGNRQLQAYLAQLQHQFDVPQRLLFGPTCERRLSANPYQMMPGEGFEAQATDLRGPQKQSITYTRGQATKVRPEDCVRDSGVRFDASVPVETIELPTSDIA